jgi:hypothetical protein
MRAKMRAALYNPASLAKLSDASKARWADPAMHENIVAKLRAAHADPAVRQKKVSVTRARWAAAMREKIIAAMRTAQKRRRKSDIPDR